MAGVGEGNGPGWSYGRVERVFGGAIDGGAQGRAAGLLRRLGKGVGTANFGGQRSSPVSGAMEKKSMFAGREAYNANGGDVQLPHRLATQAGKQAACLHARTRRCARGGRAGQGAGDPHRITVAGPYPPSFCLL